MSQQSDGLTADYSRSKTIGNSAVQMIWLSLNEAQAKNCQLYIKALKVVQKLIITESERGKSI